MRYQWRLPELMAQHGMTETSALRPRLAERGIELSRETVFRLVKNRPERISVPVLVALCEIFSCGPQDLIAVGAGTPIELEKSARPRKLKEAVRTKRVALH